VVLVVLVVVVRVLLTLVAEPLELMLLEVEAVLQEMV
tara:strand:- start:640 stop:750 length:111 start_codon:yes stop_codon:yes gene_type:complete